KSVASIPVRKDRRDIAVRAQQEQAASVSTKPPRHLAVGIDDRRRSAARVGEWPVASGHDVDEPGSEALEVAEIRLRLVLHRIAIVAEDGEGVRENLVKKTAPTRRALQCGLDDHAAGERPSPSVADESTASDDRTGLE